METRADEDNAGNCVVPRWRRGLFEMVYFVKYGIPWIVASEYFSDPQVCTNGTAFQ